MPKPLISSANSTASIGAIHALRRYRTCRNSTSPPSDASSWRSPPPPCRRSAISSVEEVWLFPADPCEQRLEAEPAGEVGTHLTRSVLSHRGLDQHRRSCGFSHQLRM